MKRGDEVDTALRAALFAADEMDARLRNQLARAACHAELLTEDAGLHPEARERAAKAYAALWEATGTLSRLLGVVRRELGAAARRPEGEGAAH